MNTRLLCITFAATFFLFLGNLSAQEKTFGELVGEAKTAYDGGEYSKAVDLLLAANRLQPNSRLLLNVARSYDKAGDCKNSLGYYGAFQRSDAEQSLKDTAQAEADAIQCDTFDETASGRTLFKSQPSGATVTMDGETLGVTPFEKVQIPTGIHTFVFSLEGKKDEEKKLQLTVGKDLTIEQRLVDQQVATTTEPDDKQGDIQEQAPPPEEKDYTQHYIAGGVAAAGVGLLVMGLVFDLAIIPSTDEDRDATVPGSPEYDELTDKRSGQATVAIIGYVSGSILAVGGAAWLTYLILTDSGDDGEDRDKAIEDRIGIAPTFGEDSAGLTVFGRF